MKTSAHYNINAKKYYDRKVVFNRQHLYDWFTPHLRQGGRVLDAGCGPGLDIQAFLDRGYIVEAIDASREMVKLAIQHSHHPVSCISFEEMEFNEYFDGIWANASLVHYSMEKLLQIFPRFIRALKDDGYWYIVFRHGSGIHMYGQIPFHLHTETSLQALFDLFPELQKVDTRVRGDWISCIVKKVKIY